jgi:hypothetical protein
MQTRSKALFEILKQRNSIVYEPIKNKKYMRQRRIKFYSLDYLTYVNEVRIQEEEQIEMGWMEEQERASMSEIYRRYSETNGTELTANIKNIIY